MAQRDGRREKMMEVVCVVVRGVTLYVDLYQDHPSMIFCLFMTAGHLSHSTLVADQDFLTAEEKNVAYSR